MNIIIEIILLFIIVFSGIFWIQRRMAKAQSIIHKWAYENGYSLLSARYLFLFRGPYSFISSWFNMVYHICVIDKNGTQKEGFIRLGNWFIGLFSGKIKVTWK